MDLQHLQQAVTAAANKARSDARVNSTEAEHATNVAIATVIERVSSAFKNNSHKVIKASAGDMVPKTDRIYHETPQYSVTLSVGTPANRFDKDVFMSAVAKEYDIPLSRLHAIAAGSTKTSAAPVSVKTIVKSEE